MSADGEHILHNLALVDAERQARQADSTLARQVLAIKAWQHQRFSQTYADLLNDPRHAGATQFFLDDLYGPKDFADRDAQFKRVVPALVRLFPQELVETVKRLGELHALSEQLDTAMAKQLIAQVVDARSYGHAWRHASSPAQREQQIKLVLAVGTALDTYTRKPLLRHTLRVMRPAAQAAGLGELQHFLETGFDTFRALRGAGPFLAAIEARETAEAQRLFTEVDADDTR